MQYLFVLFMFGASVAAAAFTPPPSSAPPPPGPPRFSAPQPSSQSIPPPQASTSWLKSLFGGPTLSPPVPTAVTTPSQQQEDEQEEIQTPFDLFKPLSDAELQVYKDAAKEKCINILIASTKRGFYYNGELIDVGLMAPDIFTNEARIAGDRLAYVMRNGRDGKNYVIVDDEVVGPLSLVRYAPSSPRAWLQLNEKHYGYIVETDYIRKEYRSVLHLIYDGKDLGEVVAPFGFKLNGDYVIYHKKEADTALYHLYINGKKSVEALFADFDGKNFGYIPVGKAEGDSKFTLDGKKLGYGGSLVLKDGHRAYVLGRTPNVIDPKVYYDGKVIGPGNEPVIEKNHLAYLRSPADVNKKSTDIRSKVIYDGKEYGYIAGYGFDISLAGDHMAYVRLPDESRDLLDQPQPPDITASINIDGKDFPGEFGWNDTYVQIAEKVDRSTCISNK